MLILETDSTVKYERMNWPNGGALEFQISSISRFSFVRFIRKFHLFCSVLKLFYHLTFRPSNVHGVEVLPQQIIQCHKFIFEPKQQPKSNYVCML